MFSCCELTMWRKNYSNLKVFTVFSQLVHELKLWEKNFENYKQLNRRRNKL